MQRRQRDLARADEEQLAAVDLVDLAAVGGEEARLLHRVLAHEHRRHDRREPLAARGSPSTHCTSASSSSTASPMRYAKREPLIATACSGLTKPMASPNAAWSSAGGGRGVADGAHDLAVVLAAVGHRRVGRVRELQRERAERRRRLRRARPRAPVSSSLRAPAAAICAGRSSGAALPISFDAAFWRARSSSTRRWQLTARGVGGEHVVDQTRRDPLALDPGAVLGLVAEALGGRSRRVLGLARSACAARRATRSASRHALVAARRRTWPSSPATGYEPRNFTSACFAARLRRQSATSSSSRWPSKSMKKQ